MRDAKSTDVSWRAISEVALKCLEDAIDGGEGETGRQHMAWQYSVLHRRRSPSVSEIYDSRGSLQLLGNRLSPSFTSIFCFLLLISSRQG